MICNQAGVWKNPLADIVAWGLLLLSLVLNPFLYTFSRRQCRNGLRRTLCWCCCPMPETHSQSRRSTITQSIHSVNSHAASSSPNRNSPVPLTDLDTTIPDLDSVSVCSTSFACHEPSFHVHAERIEEQQGEVVIVNPINSYTMNDATSVF